MQSTLINKPEPPKVDLRFSGPSKVVKSKTARVNKYNLTIPSTKITVIPSGKWVGKRQRNLNDS